MKPISTLMKPLPSVDSPFGRGDERVHRAQRRMCGAGGSRDRRNRCSHSCSPTAVLETFPGDTIGMLRDYVGAWREKIRAR